MTQADYLEAVEDAFRAAKEGRANAPAPMHLPASGGGFHAKGASYRGRRAYAALKLNGNFPGNPARTGQEAREDVRGMRDFFRDRGITVDTRLPER